MTTVRDNIECKLSMPQLAAELGIKWLQLIVPKPERAAEKQAALSGAGDPRCRAITKLAQTTVHSRLSVRFIRNRRKRWFLPNAVPVPCAPC